MNKLIILSAPTVHLLEVEAEKYHIESLGSLTIANSHLYLAIMGHKKELPSATKVETEEPKVTKEEPKPKGPLKKSIK